MGTVPRKRTGGMSMVKAVVGANWGDEGKGKITDMLAREADIVILQVYFIIIRQAL